MKRPGLSLKWVVIWSLREGAEQGATGGFDRQVGKPIASLLLRQQTNQKPPISTKPPERLFVPDGPPASCVGALMSPNLGLLLTRKGSISLQYNTASLAPKKAKQRRGQQIHLWETGIESNSSNLCWFQPLTSATFGLMVKTKQLTVASDKKKKRINIINGIWADRTRHERQQRAVNALIAKWSVSSYRSRKKRRAVSSRSSFKKVANHARNIVSAPSFTKEALVDLWWGLKTHHRDLHRPGNVHARAGK